MIPDRLGDLYRHLKRHVTELEARMILRERAGLEWAAIIANPDWKVENLSHIESDLRRRLAGEPLSRIYGVREFYGLKFKIGPGILDPRPDTETLVYASIQKFHVKQNIQILDLGTGSGCILISLLYALPQAQGVGVDVSDEILQISSHNAKALGLDNRARFIRGNWFETVAGQQFDLIVSNPPYIASHVIPNLDPEVRNHDPILALDGGSDGLDAYRKIFSGLPQALKKGGRAFLEIGYDQEDSVKRLAEESRIRVECVHRDLADKPRVVEITCGDN